MSNFEKYLAVWVALCMIAGVVISQTVPGVSAAIDAWQIRGISVPIGICLFLMMYPAMLNLQIGELRRLRKNPTPILLALFSNWIVAPIVAAVATLEPEQAAKPAQPMIVPMPIPAGKRDSHLLPMVYASRLIPALKAK